MFIDREVTKEVPKNRGGVLGFLTKISGVWVHPEAGAMTLDNNSLLFKGSRERIVAEYDTSNKTSFVFTYVYFENRASFCI